jgi:hypothetical protein
VETGREHFPAQDRGLLRHALQAQAAEVRGKLLEDEGITLAQLRDWIEETLGTRVHISSVDWFIARRDTVIKKTLRPSEQEHADVAAARLAWRDWQKTGDSARLIFLDETGASTDMTRRHGRYPVGERCQDHAPGDQWKTMTFVASLYLDELVAP